jgi:hypothetical protein
MATEVRVTTKASEFERRKQEHINAGYEIQNEQPVPINGLCWFTAVPKTSD